MSRGAPRRSFPSGEKERHVTKAITADSLASAGKADPLQGIPSGIRPEDEDDEEVIVTKTFVPIVKADADRRLITGIVLVPEQVDAHGDIYDAEVIEAAAHDFLSNYNDGSTLGLMHKDFKRDIDVLESYLAPMEFALGDRTVKQGTWILVVRVNEDSIWKKVKDGKITGFSIGGKARVKELSEKAG